MVTCRHIPRRNENMKNRHIFLSLNREKALNPKLSAREVPFLLLSMGQSGSEKAYIPARIPQDAEANICM